MKKLFIGLLVAGLLVLGVGAVSVAYAEDGIPPFRPLGRGGPDGDPGPLHELFISEMADALGMTVDDIQSRLESGDKMSGVAAEAGYEGDAFITLMSEVNDAVIDEALAQELISEEQAERMRERGGKFGQGGRGPGGSKGGRGDGQLSEYLHPAIAEALGITVEDFEARVEAGERLKDIAEDLGIADEDLREMMESAHEAALDQALKDGAITQEQYDQAQERRENRPEGQEGKGGKFGPGGRHHERPGDTEGQP